MLWNTISSPRSSGSYGIWLLRKSYYYDNLLPIQVESNRIIWEVYVQFLIRTDVWVRCMYMKVHSSNLFFTFLSLDTRQPIPVSICLSRFHCRNYWLVTALSQCASYDAHFLLAVRNPNFCSTILTRFVAFAVCAVILFSHVLQYECHTLVGPILRFWLDSLFPAHHWGRPEKQLLTETYRNMLFIYTILVCLTYLKQQVHFVLLS